MQVDIDETVHRAVAAAEVEAQRVGEGFGIHGSDATDRLPSGWVAAFSVGRAEPNRASKSRNLELFSRRPPNRGGAPLETARKTALLRCQSTAEAWVGSEVGLPGAERIASSRSSVRAGRPQSKVAASVRRTMRGDRHKGRSLASTPITVASVP
jgi:hypothetical protein